MTSISSSLVRSDQIEKAILVIRNQKVMLDSDLAALYEVETRILIRAVKRNLERFPEDFMFQLNQREFEILKASSEEPGRWGGRRYAPYAFTEQGVAMLSSVLRSKRAVQVNVEIIRVFVRLRRILSEHKILNHRIDKLEKRVDARFRIVFDAIKQLMSRDAKTKRVLGLRPDSRDK